MASITEKNRQSDVLRYEVEPNLSRENVTVVTVAALTKGQVLGIKTADGKYYPSVDGAADGTQNAVAVLLEDLPITAGVKSAVLRRLGIVIYDNLIFDATSYTTQGKKDTAVANLKSSSMIVAVPAGSFV